MNQKVFNVLMFTTGAVIGSLVTYKVVKTKYEQIMQEEIDAFKEDYAECMRESSGKYNSCENEWDDCEDDESDEDDSNDSEVYDYSRLANKYQTASNKAENDRKGEGGDDGEVPYINGPYVITPDDFGSGEYDYDLYCLTYYADGVLSNDWYEKLDIDETIGEDSIEHFGDYEEDVLHVRNERVEAEYEVTRDPRNYADIIANDPLLSNAYAN